MIKTITWKMSKFEEDILMGVLANWFTVALTISVLSCILSVIDNSTDLWTIDKKLQQGTQICL